MTVDRHDTHLSVESRRRRERRLWGFGYLLSALFHLLLFLLMPGGVIDLSPFPAAGPDESGDRAAEGLQLLAFSSAPPNVQAQPLLIPVPDVTLVEPVPIMPEVAPEITLDAVDLPDPGIGRTIGSDAADLADAGIPGGTGTGDAGVVNEGVSRLIPPSPRGMIIPPTNRELRGRAIEIWVFVNESGRVVPDSTQLRPPTSDRSFNEQLAREAAQWIFEPARQNGAPISAWFPYTISM